MLPLQAADSEAQSSATAGRKYFTVDYPSIREAVYGRDCKKSPSTGQALRVCGVLYEVYVEARLFALQKHPGFGVMSVGELVEQRRALDGVALV
ncbi:hypothetical protein GCM10011297_11630 [Bacterioplanes sanyensis]|nr:hypothetical protein GCM10011297_11630 [Bacterioplanes sanyensis]